MKFFRTESTETSSSVWKYLVWGGVIGLIVGSFILQMALGVCPVP